MFAITPITINELILGITALIILLYTFFTLLLWRQSVVQTNVSLMPIPIIYARKIEGETKKKFRIRNLGYGPLLNIHLEEWILNVTDTGDSWKIVLKMSPPNVLAKDEERDLIMETYKNNIRVDNFDMSPHLDPDFANFYIPINIIFEDIRGIKYVTTIALGKGQLSVVKPVKRLRDYTKFLRKICENFIQKKS